LVKVTGRVTVKVTEKVTENQEIILAEMKANPHVTAKELSEIVSISERKIKENIKKLKDRDLIRIRNSGIRGTRYSIH